jgi:hypothetical protein
LEKNPDSVTCKRTIVIKAVVTESFKKLLALEVQQGMEEANRRMQQYEAECNHAIDTLKSRPDAAVITSKINARLEEEKNNFESVMAQFRQRMVDIKAMAIGDLFQHGTAEGLTSIRVGDNLYQKLSAMEVVIKDGIVQEIFPTGMPASRVS